MRDLDVPTHMRFEICPTGGSHDRLGCLACLGTACLQMSLFGGAEALIVLSISPGKAVAKCLFCLHDPACTHIMHLNATKGVLRMGR